METVDDGRQRKVIREIPPYQVRAIAGLPLTPKGR